MSFGRVFDLAIVVLLLATGVFAYRVLRGAGGDPPAVAPAAIDPAEAPNREARPAHELRDAARAAADTKSAARITASTTEGTAPLPVFFDALASTLEHGTKHDARYTWRIEGPAEGVTKVVERVGGFFCFAHVFEAPGTYTVTLQIDESAGGAEVATASTTTTVRVAAFEGTTFYVSSQGDDERDGRSPETAWATIDRALNAIDAPNTRLLFRRGDRFPTTRSYVGRVNGTPAEPVVLGAYGEGATPRVLSTGDESVFRFYDGQGKGWRITDLAFRGTGQNGTAVDGDLVDDILLLRVEVTQHRSAFSCGNIGACSNSGVYVFGCHFHDTQSIQCGISAQRLAIVDTTMERDRESHLLRIYNTKRCVLLDSRFLRPSSDGPHGRHALKLHNEDESGSRHVVIHGCRFVGSTWPVMLSPQDAVSTKDDIGDIVFERNVVVGDQVHPGNPPNNLGLTIVAHDVTVRNNRFLGPKQGDAGGDWEAIKIDCYPKLDIPPPKNIRIQHNSCYVSVGTRDNQARYAMVGITPEATARVENIWIENNVMVGKGAVHSGTALIAVYGRAADRQIVERGNLAFFPGVDGKTWYWRGNDDELDLDAWRQTGAAAKGGTGSRYGVDPLFLDAEGGNLALGTESPALGIGVPSPGVWDDCAGTLRSRTGRVDAGAFQTK